MAKFITAKEAVALIPDGAVVATDGFVCCAIPEEILTEIENRYLETGQPKDLDLYYAASQGDSGERALNHFGNEGCVKRVVGGHWNVLPRLQKLARDGKIEAYNFPQGVIAHMFRNAAQGLPFTISKTGMYTFCDPRLEGGKLNDVTKEDLVEVIELRGEEFLMYHTPKIDVAILRGTYADEMGNISKEKEVLSLDGTSIASAAKANGGIVIVQVEDIVERGSLDPKLVSIPCVMVDYVVKTSDVLKFHGQSFATGYNPALSGQTKAVLSETPPLPLNNRKVCARRAAAEFRSGDTGNLGIGMPEGVSVVLNEEGEGEKVILTVEPGIIGGVPLGGQDFGAAINPLSIINQGYQFDFYNGGGLDIAVLGLAECDKEGNVNVSKFGPRLAGCGGFIDISQNARKMIFVGTFTAGGLKQKVGDGKLEILEEGKSAKFIEKVEQITFSASYAKETGQKVLYVTERAVFRLADEGVELIEIAPGIDLEKDILAHMEFKPIISKELKEMDPAIFTDALLGLVLE